MKEKLPPGIRAVGSFFRVMPDGVNHLGFKWYHLGKTY